MKPLMILLFVVGIAEGQTKNGIWVRMVVRADTVGIVSECKCDIDSLLAAYLRECYKDSTQSKWKDYWGMERPSVIRNRDGTWRFLYTHKQPTFYDFVEWYHKQVNQ